MTGVRVTEDDAGADGTSQDSVISRFARGVLRAPRTLDPRERRLQGLELLIVLAIFPLRSTYAAIADLIERVQQGYPVASHTIPPIQGSWLAGSLGAFSYATQLAAALLVWYLLTRSGEGIDSLNLRGRQLRMDLAFILPIYIVVQ